MIESSDLDLILNIHERMQDIYLDDDLNADAKLFCFLALADIARHHRPLPASERLAEKMSHDWVARIDKSVGQLYFCHRVIRQDVPRYEGDSGTGVCVGAMIRRDGPCGKKIFRKVREIDPLTGRETTVGYCTRHWSLDHEKRAQSRREQWHENGQPRPPANTGGVLQRYLITDWNQLYDWADPGRDRAAVGGKEPTLPRPKLELIHGGKHR